MRDDLTYYIKRAEQESIAAALAGEAYVAQAHRRMHACYITMIDQLRTCADCDNPAEVGIRPRVFE